MDLNDMDLISRLPEDLIYRIMQRLRVRDAARTCLVSKVWINHFWPSYSNFEFSIRGESDQKVELECSLINERLQKSCILQNQSIKRLKLAVCWCSRYLTNNCSSFYDQLSHTAAEGKVVELDLQFNSCLSREYVWNLQPIVLATNTIQVLKLGGDISLLSCSDVDVQLPLLHKLVLSHVEVDDEVLESLLSKCPLLTSVKIQGCGKLKKIELLKHPLLSKVKVLDYSSSVLKKIEIRAQNLKNVAVERCRNQGFKMEIEIRALSVENVLVKDSSDLKTEIVASSLDNLLVQKCYTLTIEVEATCRLKRMCLQDIRMSDGNMFSKLVSKCLSIEEMVIERCDNFTSFKVQKIFHNLKKIVVGGCYHLKEINIFEAPNLRHVELTYCNNLEILEMDAPMLEIICLGAVKENILEKLVSKWVSIKDMSFENCTGLNSLKLQGLPELKMGKSQELW
ncbi:F-box/FBD/LRR-repeat protein At5g44980-like [Rutidosis leptorrhynchoides]|uniref:F-box/FBD/LRR-repeat protein At5g44980-like n=1 Tax=Rutidosis leptorrhynchoides TaxID=125765 RepID=UPI003A99267F